jgi:hypothetical protein
MIAIFLNVLLELGEEGFMESFGEIIISHDVFLQTVVQMRLFYFTLF